MAFSPITIDRRDWGFGTPDICIAVLDGAVDLDHPCFAGADLTVVPTWAGAGDAALDHGTAVASLIFGRPEGGVAGLAPGCRGLIVPVFTHGGEGARPVCAQIDLARAILTAVEHGAHVINISGGQLSPGTEPDPFLARALDTCRRHDILVTAAAGNDGCDCLHMPAAAEGIIAVGAMDADGRPLPSSNWGGAYRTGGLLAPGADLIVAAPGGGTVRRTGTSFASPVVAGIAALLLCRQLRLTGSTDPPAVRRALFNGASSCLAVDGRRCLAGRLDPSSTLSLLAGDPAMSSAVMSDAVMPAAVMSNAIAPAEFDAAGTGPSPVETPARPAAALLDAVPGIVPSDCSCGGKPGGCSCGGKGGEGGCSCAGKAAAQTAPQLVYALGQIGVDFGTLARRDSFAQAMGGMPEDPTQLLAHLETHASDAQMLIWTLNLDATPVYAIQPTGAFAALGYEKLRSFLAAMTRTGGSELASIPGIIGGAVRLQSGQVVPILVPAIRGMFSWTSSELVEHLLGPPPSEPDQSDGYMRQAGGVLDFLNRIYYDLRNLGLTAEDRALNFAATNAFQAAEVMRAASLAELDLDRIAVKKSPVCRPDSDCYDVELAFFDPENTNRASRLYRFTVDVSDVLPVSIGGLRSWTRRG
jgi:cyanobactin maturation PatA/PatG family protease